MAVTRKTKKRDEEKSNVERTKGGFFRLRGKVTKVIDNGGKGDTFSHGIINNGGKYDGSPTISARISLTTNSVEGVRNDVDVKLFAMKTDTMRIYDNSEKEMIEIPYDEWEEYLEVLDEDKRNRYSMMNSVRLKVEYKPQVDEDGEVILDENGEEILEAVTKTYPTFEALEILEDVLEKDMGLYIQGKMEYNKGVNREGEEVIYKQLTPTAIYAADVDFTDEDFQEVNEWHQQMYIVNAKDDKKNSKLKVKGRIVVNKDLDWVDTDFVVPYGELPELKEYAESIESIVEYGDLVYFGGHFRRAAKQVTHKASKFAGGKKHTASTGYGELEYVTDGTYVDDKNPEDLQKNMVTKRDFDLIKKEKENKLEKSEDEPKKAKSSFGRSTAKASSKFEDTIDIDDDDLPF